MASADWAELTGSITAASLASGVTSGITAPNGGGTFTYGFHSLTTGLNSARAIKYTGDVNFDPIPANFGGRITGALIRLPSSGTTGFAPFLYFCEQANDVSGTAYMLGLQDSDPSHIVLVKGALSSGLPDGAAGEVGILAKSTDSIAADTWVHLRLDVTVQGTGDVLLQVYQNDLSVNDVTAPVWTAVAGMSDFIDDALQINSGSAPLTGGRSGIAMHASDVNRRAAVDHVTIARQV